MQEDTAIPMPVDFDLCLCPVMNGQGRGQKSLISLCDYESQGQLNGTITECGAVLSGYDIKQNFRIRESIRSISGVIFKLLKTRAAEISGVLIYSAVSAAKRRFTVAFTRACVAGIMAKTEISTLFSRVFYRAVHNWGGFFFFLKEAVSSVQQKVIA